MMPPVGARIKLVGIRAGHHGDANHGVVTAAPAPGIRRVRWDDGTEQDVFDGEIVAAA